MVHALLQLLESSPYRSLVKQAAEVVFALTGPALRLFPGQQQCPICGARLLLLRRPVIGRALAAQWRLSQDWIAHFEQREGEICLGCGGSLRVRQLADTVCVWLKTKGAAEGSLMAACKGSIVRGLAVAELNACGAAHKAFRMIPGLAYSEYEPANSRVCHEDILELSYADELFDLVVHSDTLEHVPDVHAGLAELHRVLKPGGATIFTVPIVSDGRQTIVRAERVNGQLVYHKERSFHGGSYQSTQQYLVCYEFGSDFEDAVREHGFNVEVHKSTTNPAVVSLICRKPPSGHGAGK
ncbi:MAG: class I SAM-dependent methyltransferase [Planctomycetia bacterium]